jgi:hypothetical protein
MVEEVREVGYPGHSYYLFSVFNILVGDDLSKKSNKVLEVKPGICPKSPFSLITN